MINEPHHHIHNHHLNNEGYHRINIGDFDEHNMNNPIPGQNMNQPKEQSFKRKIKKFFMRNVLVICFIFMLHVNLLIMLIVKMNIILYILFYFFYLGLPSRIRLRI